MVFHRWFVPLFACALLLGCSSILQSKPEKDLAAGIKSYEDGDYPAAMKLLQGSLDSGLRGTSDQVNAHKHLAFIHCVSGRERPCREEFGKALDIDPAFDLEPGEAGHPIWGPAFRSVKARR